MEKISQLKSNLNLIMQRFCRGLVTFVCVSHSVRVSHSSVRHTKGTPRQLHVSHIDKQRGHIDKQRGHIGTHRQSKGTHRQAEGT